MLSPEGHTAGSIKTGNVSPGSDPKVLCPPSGQQMRLLQPHVRAPNTGGCFLTPPTHTPAQGFTPQVSWPTSHRDLNPKAPCQVAPTFLLPVPPIRCSCSCSIHPTNASLSLTPGQAASTCW